MALQARAVNESPFRASFLHLQSRHARIVLSHSPRALAGEPYGIIDVLSVLPTYLMVFFPGMQALLVLRVLRMLRMFRVLEMVRHVNGAELLVRALYGARAKITVFFTFMLALTCYAVIAVPTGILTSELSKLEGDDSTDACPSCGVHGHLPDARFCRRCGAPMG